MPDLDTDKLRRYVDLSKSKREHKKQLKKINKELNDLEGELLDQFEEVGMQNVHVDGMTVYIHRQLWAKAQNGDYEKACAALRAVGLDEYVNQRFNTNSISAWVREQEELGHEIPEELQEALDISEVFSLRTRKG